MGDGIRNFAAGTRDYWVVDIYRPEAELRRLLEEWRPAGVITQSIPKIPAAILSSGIPTVVLTFDGSNPAVGRVDVDDVAVGAEAAKHLLETGLRNFAFFGKDEHYSGQRLAGFQASLRKAKKTSFSKINWPKVERQLIEYWHDRDDKLEQWLKALPKPVGIFATHDPMGRFLAEACRHCGFRI
jgi:LacI family transcriptional regulator